MRDQLYESAASDYINSDAIKSHTKRIFVKAVLACLLLSVGLQGRNSGAGIS